MRILIIEDDPQLGDGLFSGLKSLGFSPDWVRDARHTCRAVCDAGPALQPAGSTGWISRMDQPDGSGVGLGLSIVLRIAEQYRGSVAFGPGLDGRGLAVTVELPGTTNSVGAASENSN